MKETKKISEFENIVYYLFNICTLGSYYVLKVVIKKALIELK